jgi:hypothetical protein
MNITSAGQEADRGADRAVPAMRLHGHPLEGNQASILATSPMSRNACAS